MKRKNSSHGMTPYLKRIWNQLVRQYHLKTLRDDDDARVLSQEQVRERLGGPKNYKLACRRYLLTYHKIEDYLEFQQQVYVQIFRQGRFMKEEITVIPERFTLSSDGSKRHMYRHDGAREIGVRTISLKNFYLLHNEEVARLIMITHPGLEWIRELPFTFHPVSNKELLALDSIEALIAHYAGGEVLIPKRLRLALSLADLLMLVRLVPGDYLNALSATLKAHAKAIAEPVTVPRLLTQFYKTSIVDAPGGLYHKVHSYIGACQGLGMKLNMRIKSLNRLEAERGVVVRDRQLARCPEIRTHANFIFPEADFGDVRLELINSTKRLGEESRRMKSCIASYGSDVTDGRCGLYHVTYRGRPYSMELRYGPQGHLKVNSLLGFCNRKAPKLLMEKVEKIVAKYSPKKGVKKGPMRAA